MLTLILYLALVGFVVWLIVRYIPMPEVIRNVILAVVVVCMILYLLSALGIADMRLPRVR